MKKVLAMILATIVISLGALATTARATDFVTFDGDWWTGLTSTEQITAVQALMAGYEVGYQNGFVNAATSDNAHYHSTRSFAQLSKDPEALTMFSKPLAPISN